MRKINVLVVGLILLVSGLKAQRTSAEIAAQIKGLKTVGSVLYLSLIHI